MRFLSKSLPWTSTSDHLNIKILCCNLVSTSNPRTTILESTRIRPERAKITCPLFNKLCCCPTICFCPQKHKHMHHVPRSPPTTLLVIHILHNRRLILSCCTRLLSHWALPCASLNPRHTAVADIPALTRNDQVVTVTCENDDNPSSRRSDGSKTI